jgi:hypothetical protein
MAPFDLLHRVEAGTTWVKVRDLPSWAASPDGLGRDIIAAVRVFYPRHSIALYEEGKTKPTCGAVAG